MLPIESNWSERCNYIFIYKIFTHGAQYKCRPHFDSLNQSVACSGESIYFPWTFRGTQLMYFSYVHSVDLSQEISMKNTEVCGCNGRDFKLYELEKYVLMYCHQVAKSNWKKAKKYIYMQKVNLHANFSSFEDTEIRTFLQQTAAMIHWTGTKLEELLLYSYKLYFLHLNTYFINF